MLAFELNFLRDVGLDSATSLAPSIGDPDRGLEENGKAPFLCFFCSILGGALSGGSSMGVRAEMGGRNMLKLFLRRLSDIIAVKLAECCMN